MRTPEEIYDGRTPPARTIEGPVSKGGLNPEPTAEVLANRPPPPGGSGDNVNHPSHYTFGSIEVIDAIEGLGLASDFCLGNVLKYIARARHKGRELEDLKKAEWYLKRKIQFLEQRDKSAGKNKQ